MRSITTYCRQITAKGMVMRKPKAVGLGAKMMDEESRAILYDGCSLSQLSTIFDSDNREVARKIKNLAPCGERMGYPIYKLSEAAAFLIPPQGDIAEAIKKMSPKDLPPALTKEFWAGQHARLKFEEDQGDLWRTSYIIEKLSELFKTLRMSILLMQDQVERQTALTDQQRDIIRTMTDGVLNDLANSLIERFKNEPDREQEEAEWSDPDAFEDEEEAL